MDDLVRSLATLDPAWIYATIFFVSFLENVFPPAPSDTVVVIGGALAAVEKGNFLIALAAGTLGSTVGFMLMYHVGKWFGRKILDAGKLPFIKHETVLKIEQWFLKWGFWLIIANRFLSGTRAVVSFFAGISNLDLFKTTLLSFLSSLLWYGILVYAGYSLGEHYENIFSYMKSYSQVVTAMVVVVVLIVLSRYFYKKKKSDQRR